MWHLHRNFNCVELKTGLVLNEHSVDQDKITTVVHYYLLIFTGSWLVRNSD